MLQSLEIRGFRGFESYRLEGLARVNLVVGQNNCGKTSVLEAIELLVSGGHESAFLRLMARRGGTAMQLQRGLSDDISHVFHGHKCVPGAAFELSADDGRPSLSARIVPLDELDDSELARIFQWSSGRYPGEDIVPAFAMRIDRSEGELEQQFSLPVTENGSIMLGYPARGARNGASGIPIQFLTLEASDPASMGKMWNTVVTEGREQEQEIVDDLKLLEPELDSIYFLTNTGLGNRILMGLHDGGRRLPISTWGDGVQRLLALRLSFVGAASGILLVDEIDTGLHWTAMRDIWQLVIEVARKANAQVFATTHSYDCIRGLGGLLKSQPSLAEEVSIQKIHSSLEQAVCLQGDQIGIAVDHDIEVR